MVRGFLRANAMPVVAAVAALASCAFVPPDAGYSGYVDWGTIARLAAMLAVVAALREAGVFQAAAHALVARCKGTRSLMGVLVAVSGLTSMFVTNDMALLALLPLAAAVFLEVGRDDLVAPTFVLQGLAANLCGMLLPFGNPQNIFLSARYSLGIGEFVRTMLPPFGVSCMLIAAAWAALTRREGRGEGALSAPASAPLRQDARGNARIVALFVLLGVCVAAVLGIVEPWIALLVVAAALTAIEKGPAFLQRMDWGLLATFVAFFVFSGNLARIEPVQSLFSGWLAGGAFVPAALLSQIISNVPASVVLARFTGDWAGLLAGVNVGGAGTPVGSLATLIVISQFQGLSRRLPQTRRANLQHRRFLGLLVGLNLGFLGVLLFLGVLVGW